MSTLEPDKFKNLYRDTRERMAHDAEFHGVVMSLVVYAEREGLTPGELKQIAFAAALIVEERNAHPMITMMVGTKGPTSR